MNEKYIDKNEPPYTWMPAYGIFESKIGPIRDKLLKNIRPQYPFLTDASFKIIQFASMPWDTVFESVIVRGATWCELKHNILYHMSKITDERAIKIQIESIEDIAISYTPYSDFMKFGCIDTEENDPFTVIADNAIVFLHQIKRKNMGWIFQNVV